MKDALEKLVEEKQEQELLYAHLKENSDYYPEIYFKERGNAIYYSTIIRIYRDRQWLVVHCVEKYDKDGPTDKATFMANLGWSIYHIQHCYEPNTSSKDIDRLQIPESERIRLLFDVKHEEK
jgi:hypothetical protein